MFRIIRCAALLLLVAVIPAGATDYYVSINGGSNQTGDGLSPATAWRNITYALGQITGDGHTIHVAPGVYDDTPDGGGLFEVYPLTLGVNMSLIGSGSASTVLDAEQKGRAIQVHSSPLGSTLSGFTVKRGDPGLGSVHGGGISILNSTAALTDLTIRENVASKGGGIYAYAAVVHLQDTRIESNYSSTAGGGLYLEGSSATCQRLVAESNDANINGGAIYLDNSSFTAQDRLMLRLNKSGSHGSAISMEHAGSSFVLQRGATFADNTAANGAATVMGASIDDLYLTDCTFRNNTGTSLLLTYTSAFLESCLFERNSSPGANATCLHLSGDNTRRPMLEMRSCVIRDCTNTGGGAAGLYSTHTQSFLVRDCIFERNHSAGHVARLSGYGSGTIENNAFRDNGVEAMCPILLSFRSENSVVKGNHFNGNCGTCIEAGAFTFRQAIISQNELCDNLGFGVTTYPGDFPILVITNNVIARAQLGGIRLEFASANPSLFAGNTIADCGGDAIYTANAVRAVGNILCGNTGIAIVEGGTSADVTAYNNLFFNNAGGLFRDENLTTYSNLSFLEDQVPEVFDNLEGDPLFLGAAAGNYRLQAGSPCIDAGTSTNAPSVDFDGEPRPQGAGYDIGADERHGAHAADANENLVIEDFEMLHYVDDWAATLVTQPELDEARTLWRCLKGYRADGGGAWECR